MTATTAGDVVLEHTDSSTQVTITTSGDEENLTKSLILITPPKSTDNQSIASDSVTKIIDLLMKAEQRITIDGFLCYNADASDTHSTAAGKKSDLKSMFRAGGVLSMTYEGDTFNVNSDKLSIKRIVTDGQAAAVGEAEFSVKMTMVRGED